MDKKKLISTFSSGGVLLACFGLFSQTSAMAQANVSFGANGPQAVIPQQAAATSVAPSLGDTGSYGRTSYPTGEAPNSAGLSGNETQKTLQNYPLAGPGTNFGPNMTGAVNGLMAPNSIGNGQLRSWGGASYGFNTNPQVQVYSMATGADRLIQNTINNATGGAFTIGGPRLPVTSTGSIDLDSTGAWPPGK